MLGGLTFASPGKTPSTRTIRTWSARAPASPGRPTLFKGKTVFRGGFGMFVAPVTIANLAITGSYSTNPEINQEGFSQTTSMLRAQQRPGNPTAAQSTLSNPFPNGFTAARRLLGRSRRPSPARRLVPQSGQ